MGKEKRNHDETKMIELGERWTERGKGLVEPRGNKNKNHGKSLPQQHKAGVFFFLIHYA